MRRRNRRRRAAKVIRVLMVPATLALVGLAVLLFLDLSAARTRLSTARTLLREATANPTVFGTTEGREAALQTIDRSLERITTARGGLRKSFALSLVRGVPGLATQRSGLLQLTDDGIVAASAARDLVTEVDRLANETTIVGGRVPLGPLGELTSAMKEAGEILSSIDSGGAGLWGPLRDARRDFDEIVVNGAERLEGGADALGAAATFMGSETNRTYLVAIQNNAEMRDQGMVLSYAVVRFSNGRLTFEDNGSVLDLSLAEPTDTRLPEGTEAFFGPLQPTLLWQSVNATADFPLSARIMVDMYEATRDERLDGVIAVDVPALALLLSAVGPVQVPDIPTPITAVNAADVLLRDIYRGVGRSDEPERREMLDEITREISDRLTTETQDGVGLGLQLAEAARGHHVRLWSSIQAEEAVFEHTGLGGGPATDLADRTFHLAVENRTATKLDYYVTTRVRHEVVILENGDAVVNTTLVIDNQAPTDQPESSYALGPDENMSRAGEYHAWVLMWAPADSQSSEVTVLESGLLLSQRVVIVAPGTQRELRLATTTIPNAVRDGHLDLRLVPQPRLEAPELEIAVEAVGWNLGGESFQTTSFDSVVHASWAVRR